MCECIKSIESLLAVYSLAGKHIVCIGKIYKYSSNVFTFRNLINFSTESFL